MLHGSDVSEFQALDTVPRKEDRFWYVRLGDGSSYVDKAYGQHINAAFKGGLEHVGPYLFWRAADDPIRQAQRLINALRVDTRLMAGAIDVEEDSCRHADGRPDGLTLEDRARRLKVLITYYQQAVTMPIVVYTNRDTMMRLLNFSAVKVSGYDRLRVETWAASWGASPSPIPVLPAPILWQDADYGGAGGGDHDIAFTDLKILHRVRIKANSPIYTGGIEGRTLRLAIAGHPEFVGWDDCLGPMRWIQEHGLQPNTPCEIAWNHHVWSGAADVTGVVNNLLSRIVVTS